MSGAPPGAVSGMSCTWPSVMAIDAGQPRRAGCRPAPGRWRANSRVPALPPSGTVTVRSSRSGSFAACCVERARAPPRPARARSPTCIEADWSTTSRPMSGRLSRVSCTSRGPASHSSSTAKASEPPDACRARAARRPARATTSSASTPSAAISQTGSSGSKRDASAIGLLADASPSHWPSRSQDRRHVHLVALVVAGQRVHHEVDAEPVGQRALARAAGDHRVGVAPAVIDRPGRRPSRCRR